MDKTDIELLQAAAKAAGYRVARLSDDDSALFLVGVQQAWNPLTDDGDALRLAVALEIDLCFGANYVIADGEQVPTVNNANNPGAAVRRAIVLAAAAMVEKT
jgi:hypothetical protein